MYAFAVAAGVLAVLLVVRAWSRPGNVAVVGAAGLLLAYAVYEWLVASEVLCSADCNIRVDLVAILPILIAAVANALRPAPSACVFVALVVVVLGLVGALLMAVRAQA